MHVSDTASCPSIPFKHASHHASTLQLNATLPARCCCSPPGPTLLRSSQQRSRAIQYLSCRPFVRSSHYFYSCPPLSFELRTLFFSSFSLIPPRETDTSAVLSRTIPLQVRIAPVSHLYSAYSTSKPICTPAGAVSPLYYYPSIQACSSLFYPTKENGSSVVQRNNTKIVLRHIPATSLNFPRQSIGFCRLCFDSELLENN